MKRRLFPDKTQFTTWIDRISFRQLLLIWIGIIAIFGILYYFLSGTNATLYSTLSKSPVSHIFEAIYFSFITATSTGYGDIIPKGGFQIIVIFEVIAGLLLLALVTSKLVSLKQNLILNEIYEISLNEKINRIRSSLLLYRQQISRIARHLGNKRSYKVYFDDVNISVHNLENVLQEILVMVRKKNLYVKNLDSVGAGLIMNSVVQSFKRTHRLISDMNRIKDWKEKLNINLLNNCIKLNESIFESISKSSLIDQETLTNLNSDNDTILKTLKDSLK